MQVLEAQPTFGGGARSAADPEFDGILHDVCSAVHPLALGSRFFAEFDLRARGVQFGVPDISYGNPLTGRPGRDRVPGPRPHLRGVVRRCVLAAAARTAGRASGHRARFHARRQAFTALGSGQRRAAGAADSRAGHARLEPAATRRRRASIDDGRCCTRHFATAVADFRRRGDDARDAGPHRGRLADTDRRHPGDHRRADRRPAGPRRRASRRHRGDDPPGGRGAVRHRPDRAVADLPGTRTAQIRKAVEPLSLRSGRGEGRLRPVRRHSLVGRPPGATPRRCTSAAAAAKWPTPKPKSRPGGTRRSR